jgi:hypothetical protein
MRPIALPSVLAIMAACGVTDPASQPHMEATINGTLWHADAGRCYQETGDTTLLIDGDGWTDSGSFYSIRLWRVPAAIGTYPFHGYGDAWEVGTVEDCTFVFFCYDYKAHSGSVSVTEFDVGARRCSGTFSFGARYIIDPWRDTLSVTNGSWSWRLGN